MPAVSSPVFLCPPKHRPPSNLLFRCRRAGARPFPIAAGLAAVRRLRQLISVINRDARASVLGVESRRRFWARMLDTGRGCWPWMLAVDTGRGYWPWILAVDTGRGYWPWILAVDTGRGYWPWMPAATAEPDAAALAARRMQSKSQKLLSVRPEALVGGTSRSPPGMGDLPRGCDRCPQRFAGRYAGATDTMS